MTEVNADDVNVTVYTDMGVGRKSDLSVSLAEVDRTTQRATVIHKHNTDSNLLVGTLHSLIHYTMKRKHNTNA